MLAHMTNTNDDIPLADESNRRSKPSIFHEIHCKTGINLEGLTRMAPKAHV